MSELKRCPFCGGKAKLDKEDIFCDNCYLSLSIYDRITNGEAETYEEARKQAIEAWNTRTPVDKVIERLEEEKGIAFLTLANTGDSKYDLVYDNVMAYINKAIEIIKEEVG